MISIGDLARSYSAFGAQTAANPASSSAPLPPAATLAAELAATASTGARVSISAEGLRQLQRATQVEQEQTVNLQAAAVNAELAARLAYDIAYRREVIVVPPAGYSDLATSLYSGATSIASNAASIARAQSDADQARMARIAVYELEKARGTPPAQIYQQLLGLASTPPVGYRISIAS